jgi:hypothetical protein
VQSGRQAAKNILLSMAGKPRQKFDYVDKGSLATIGRNKAVAQLGRFCFTGAFAWWLWLVVHVLSLVEFRSRLSVLMEWAFAYFTWQRRSRVILEVPHEPAPARPANEFARVLSLEQAAEFDARSRLARAQEREHARPRDPRPSEANPRPRAIDTA